MYLEPYLAGMVENLVDNRRRTTSRPLERHAGKIEKLIRKNRCKSKVARQSRKANRKGGK